MAITLSIIKIIALLMINLKLKHCEILGHFMASA